MFTHDKDRKKSICNEYLPSLNLFPCVLSALECLEILPVFVSMFSDLRNPVETFSKLGLFVMVRDMRLNNFQPQPILMGL